MDYSKLPPDYIARRYTLPFTEYPLKTVNVERADLAFWLDMYKSSHHDLVLHVMDRKQVLIQMRRLEILLGRLPTSAAA